MTAVTPIPEDKGPKSLVTSGETAAVAMAATNKATIEALFAMAEHRPRNVMKFRSDILEDCKRPGFADKAIYQKPVGRDREGKQKYQEGMSIRFAEASLRHFGNLYCQATCVFDDDDQQIYRVMVMDLERHSVDSKDVNLKKTVERRFLKKGQKALSERKNSYGDDVFLVQATDDDMLNKVNAAIAKAKRNLIIEFLPFDIVEEAQQLCYVTMDKRDAADPQAAVKRMVDQFAQVRVSVADLMDYLGKPVERLSKKEAEHLKGILNALRGSEVTWDEVMEDRKPKQTAGKAKNAMDEEAKDGEEKDAFGLPDPNEETGDPTPSEGESQEGADTASTTEAAAVKKKTKSALLVEIGKYALDERSLADYASKAAGQTVMDHTKLKRDQLEKMLDLITEPR